MSAFRSERGADEALDAIVAAKKEQLVKIREAAVVRRDAVGKLVDTGIEQRRMGEARERRQPWKQWGPFVYMRATATA